MPNNKPVIFVPVDPEMYGLGMAIGCLIKFWPIFVVAGLIIWGIFGITIGLSQAENTRQANEWATEAAVYQNTRTASQANVQDRMAELEKIRDTRQASLLESEIGDSQTCGDHMTIHSLEFADDGVWLYFDASLIMNTSSEVAGSWLIWNPDHFNLIQSSEGGIVPVVAQVFKIFPDTSCDSLKVEHFTGYLVYPYSSFFNQNNSEDGILYFALGDDSKYMENLFPLIDLNHPENWNIVSISHAGYNIGLSTKELAENGNSNLILNEIEASDKTGWVTLSLTIAVDPNSDNFILKQPDQVYIIANSRKFTASRWNGVFDRYGDPYFYELGWYTSPWSRDGAIQFDGAWSEIQTAGCFDFYFGDSYAFQNICIR